jgi:hypothetical protein
VQPKIVYEFDEIAKNISEDYTSWLIFNDSRFTPAYNKLSGADLNNIFIGMKQVIQSMIVGDTEFDYQLVAFDLSDTIHFDRETFANLITTNYELEKVGFQRLCKEPTQKYVDALAGICKSMHAQLTKEAEALGQANYYISFSSYFVKWEPEHYYRTSNC